MTTFRIGTVKDWELSTDLEEALSSRFPTVDFTTRSIDGAWCVCAIGDVASAMLQDSKLWADGFLCGADVESLNRVVDALMDPYEELADEMR